MIVDRLENLGFYASLHPAMPKIIAYLRHADLKALPIGKTILDAETFLLRDSYPTQSLSDCFFEGHHSYVDIQIVLEGTEFIGYCPKFPRRLSVTVPFSAEKDVEKYEPADFSRIRMEPGMFAILFPDDLHLTKWKTEASVSVQKAIIKFKF